jgi:Heparinase II/III-like protein
MIHRSPIRPPTLSDLPMMLALAAMILVAGPAAAAQDEIVIRAHADHPRLLMTDADLTKLQASAEAEAANGNRLRSDMQRHVISTAENILKLDDILPDVTKTSAADLRKQRYFVKYDRIALKMILYCAMAYRLEQDRPEPASKDSRARQFARRAIDEMLVIARLPNWRDGNGPLSVAGFSQALAIGYDWLNRELSASERQEIVEALFEKGLKSPLRGGASNVDQVCNCGFVSAALALIGEVPAYESIIREKLTAACHGLLYDSTLYAPDGAWGEGPGYWSYGTQNYLLAVSMLEGVLARDSAFFRTTILPLSQAQGLDKTALFMFMMASPSGRIFSYSDTGIGSIGNDFAFSWLAARFPESPYNQKILTLNYTMLDEWLRSRTRNGASTLADVDAFASGTWMPLSWFWIGPGRATKEESFPLDFRTRGKPAGIPRDQGVPEIVFLRDRAEDPNALWLAIKGGANGTSHGHADLGSFCVESDGEQWGCELGAGAYSLPGYFNDKTSDSPRWMYFRAGNQGHSTLIPGNMKQFVQSIAPVSGFLSTEHKACAILDLSSVYPDAAHRIQRGFALIDRSTTGNPTRARALIQDEVAALKADTPLRWNLVTNLPRRDIVLDQDKKQAVLRRNGKSMRLTILSPAEATFSTKDAQNSPPIAGEAPNPGCTLLVATVPAVTSISNVRLAVLLEPGSAPARSLPAVEPLSAWTTQTVP